MMAIRTAPPAAPAAEATGVAEPTTGLGRSPGGRRSRRRWPWTVAVLLVLALVGGSGYVAYRTPLLGVHHVEVSASAGEMTDEVRDAVVTAADVSTGTPLITVNLQSIRRRVLGVPQVATASVSRHWPNDLRITVTVRTPVAVTKANGALWLLDATGVPYLKVGATAPAGLLTLDLATPGTHDAATLAGLAVVGQLKAPIRDQVSSISAPSAYGVLLTLRDGRTVLWGSPDDGAKKMQILPAVLAQPGSAYDISDPDLVSVH